MSVRDSIRRLLGLFLILWGADTAPEGYHQRSDVGPRQTIDGTPLPTLWDEFIARLSVFNRMHARVEALLSQPTSLVTERVAIPRRAKMEEASEYGQPKLIRTERVARGYPLVHYDIGIGYTQEFLDDATSAEIRNTFLVAEEAWRRRRRQTLYEALFNNANATDKDGVLVRRLYNADGEVPPEYESYSHSGTHTHYLTSAGASLVVADITGMETHLLHHGYGDDLPGGAGGSLFLHAPRTLMTAIRGFSGFIPAESASVPAILGNSGVIVGGQGQAGPGVQGFLGRFTIIEDTCWPTRRAETSLQTTRCGCVSTPTHRLVAFASTPVETTTRSRIRSSTATWALVSRTVVRRLFSSRQPVPTQFRPSD
jgi:hypothetical protein